MREEVQIGLIKHLILDVNYLQVKRDFKPILHIPMQLVVINGKR